jgi:hypothetical protein
VSAPSLLFRPVRREVLKLGSTLFHSSEKD